MKKALLMLILLFAAFTTSTGYGATTIFLDNFENQTVGAPQIGISALLGNDYVHQVIDVGGNHKLQSTDMVTDNGFAIYNLPIYSPLQSTTTYDFMILSPSVINSSLRGDNAFFQELILNNASGDNLFLYWGDDNQLRLQATINGNYIDPVALGYTWTYGVGYHIEWAINGVDDTFSLAVNGVKLKDHAAFGDDIAELYAFSYGTNYPTIGSQLMDNVTIQDTAAVPEPTTMLLLGLGLAGVVSLKRRMRA